MTYGAAVAVLVLIIVMLLTMLRRGPGGAQPVDPWADLGDEKRMPDLFEPATMAHDAPMAYDPTSPKASSNTLDPAPQVPGMTDLPPPLDDALPGEPLEWR